MTFPLWTAGMRVTAQELNLREPITIIKASDQPFTSDTTFAPDSELFFTADANSTYIIDLFCWCDGITAGDIKVEWLAPTGATMLRGCMGPQAGSTDRLNTAMNVGVRQTGTDVVYGTSGLGGFINVWEHCWLETGANAGTVVPQYAQNVSQSDPTTIRIGSHLTYLKVA